MSRKVSSFAQIITRPLNLYNFRVIIPGITDPDIATIVQSTSFPGEADKLQTVTKWYKGERIQYPTVPQNGGMWGINVPESDSGHTRDVLHTLREMNYDQQSGAILPASWMDIQVYAMPQNHVPGDNIPDVFSCILHGAWCRGRNDVNMAAENVTGSWNWDYQFVYQWVEDMHGSYQGSPAPISQ